MSQVQWHDLDTQFDKNRQTNKQQQQQKRKKKKKKGSFKIYLFISHEALHNSHCSSGL